MRCLYCGKELALLKRLTSGGEFCSDAHRQQYQDEYNQLALNRLLQAKPPVESKAAQETKPGSKAPDAKPVEQTKRAPEPAPAPPPAVPVMVAEPAEAVEQPVIEEPQTPDPVEEPAPADPAGFFLELPVPVMAQVAVLSAPELEMEHNGSPAMPQRAPETWGAELTTAGHLVIEPAVPIANSAEHSTARSMDRRLEVREFVRGAPVVTFDLRAERDIGVPEAICEPMEIATVRYPPEENPVLWLESPREFGDWDVESGQFARVTFLTTGFEESAGDTPAAIESEPKKAEVVVLVPEAIPAPKVQPAVSVSSVFVFESSKQNPAPPAVEKKRAPEPELITKPLPVTLHGLAAGRGKPVQVFTSGLAASVDVQVPRSVALPLRPVMTLGPAPLEKRVEAKIESKPEEQKAEQRKTPERTVVVKQDVRKPGRPEPRFANGKNRKPDPRGSEPEKKPAEVEAPQLAASSAPAEEKKENKKIEEKKVEELKPEPVAEVPAPPVDRPYTAPDLGLPSLSLDSGGFWGKLPVAGKIGVAALILMVIGGVIYLSSKSNSANAAATAPRVVEAPALALAAAGDSGWITDWGAEPGVRRQHDISVLRSSMSLTDYRLEFQAQIENKALGWIYRAQDGKNYYVSKLEIVKPGLEPTVALIRFAVINGEEQPRAQFPLSISAHLDTLYNIRFDAVGDHFTTWIQDQKVDDFTDDRLRTGGVGLYSEYGERLGLKGSVRVAPLVIKK